MLNDRDFLELIEKIYAFHTKRAPGVVIGTQMVLIAQDKLKDAKKLGAISETQVCLSDCIQYMTGCTTGNKYLKVLSQIGRYAFTLYDRQNGNGVRVYVDLDKIDPLKMPETSLFFKRQRPVELRTDMKARKQSGNKIVDEFMLANRDIFGWERVHVSDYEKGPVYPAKICSECKESFLYTAPESKKCMVCNGEVLYYVRV